MKTKFSESLAILSDAVPGVVVLSNRGIESIRFYRDQEQEIGDDMILYTSKKRHTEVPLKKEISPTESVSVDLENEALIVSGTKPDALPLWQDIARLTPTDSSKILRRSDRRLEVRKPAEDALLSLASEPVNITTPFKDVLLLPSLFAKDHPLSVLSKIGISGIQRHEDAITIVLDATKAGIVTDGAKNLIIKARREENDFVFDHADDDFKGGLLHLALSAGAILTYRIPEEKVRRGRKVSDRLDQIPSRVSEWNRDMRETGYPLLANTLPLDAEIGVVLPVTHTDVVMLTGKESESKN